MTPTHAASQPLPAGIFDTALDAVVVMDGTGHVVEWNPAAERTFGHSREEAVGANLVELIVPPDLREAHRRGLARHVEGGSERLIGRRVELTALGPGGSDIPIELTVVRLPGEPPLFAGHVRDVTERRRQEVELSRRAEQHEAVVALGHQALTGTDLDELIDHAGRLAATQLGLDFCQVWELSPDGREFALRVGVGWEPGENEGLTIPSEADTQARFTLDQGGPVLVGDFAEETRFQPPCFVGGSGVASGISVPIPGPDGAFGVIGGHARRPHAFSDADASFLDSVANVLGAAIGRRRSEESLGKAEERYRTLVERLPAVTYVAEYGAEGRWLFVSPQIEEMLGYTPEEWMADPHLWFSRVHPDDRDRVLEEEERAAAGGPSLDVEYRMIARDGRLVWVRDDAAVTAPVPGLKPVVEGFLIDVTERKWADQELRYRAEHDALTGLFNRSRFEEEIERHGGTDGPGGAVVIVDIDHFKLVNDSFGHATGDAALRIVASALRSCLRRGENASRLGGDEFAVLLPGTTKEEAPGRATELLQAVRERRGRVSVTASAGIAVFDPGRPVAAADLLVGADMALYRAKEGGRDRVALFTGQEGERLAWVGRVRQAIEEGRLALFSQPIVELASGDRVAEELLVRMVGEDGELLPPAAFLPAAERFGLVREIDRWVLDRAVDLAAAGRNVSVNLSALSVRDREVTAFLERRMAESGADAHRIVLEITETAAAANPDDVRGFASRVERIGCGLALDDFGTGFGAFTYLKHLHADQVKIDMEFVRDVAHSTADRRIVESIVGIAKALGMRTIAEGVEDEAALETLRVCGVDYVQGFHLARPAPVRP